ncbi:MAG: class I SAM-dependent methyltransferase [Gemmatimonadetes bacterium]|nr:class I SAM-dependent methyltransferase [Gemmatimonadota bacterium]MYD24655.1 class I SAM-dependent methyltransferase [Gemmatimonadota bacterium]MYI98594.1 class I SAM-dependent methyltransferase [Gemmatimonadota bacterium]
MTETAPRRTAEMHDANRRSWDNNAGSWAEMRDRDGLWRRCPEEPELGFAGGAYALIGSLAGSVEGKDVAVVGSGDNHAVFALAGMKAHVTSIDISERQLETASARADQLGLSIDFVRADATDLHAIVDSSFDLVCSTNGFFVWIADLRAVYGEVFRILKPGGFYVFYDVHPFQRPWTDRTLSIEVDKPYWQTGPIRDEKEDTFEFNWTMADLLNPGADAGLVLRRILERPAEDSNTWEGASYRPGKDKRLVDWKVNPRAALPFWLSAAWQKPA